MLIISDAVIEHEMPMSGASMFWHDALHGCNLDRSLALPYDRYRLVGEHHTGHGTSLSFDFGEDLSRAVLTYVSSNNTTVEYLALACYYLFLFKLTNGERDLCVGLNTHGRYKPELTTVIGMFVNAIPLRCQLNPHWSFRQLVKYVGVMMASSVEYSYFPLQRILAQHLNTSKPMFLDTSFDFQSMRNGNDNDEVTIGDVKLRAMPISIKISEDEIMSKFDFVLNIQHDVMKNTLSCSINASLDLFEAKTIDDIAKRFYLMSNELFQSIASDQTEKPLYELSIMGPNERILMQSRNNTHVFFPATSCIHQEFTSQAVVHPQKLAVELDNQSLTYTELLYYVQHLSSHLTNVLKVAPEEIVCQCVERSLSMVSRQKE